MSVRARLRAVEQAAASIPDPGDAAIVRILEKLTDAELDEVDALAVKQGAGTLTEAEQTALQEMLHRASLRECRP